MKRLQLITALVLTVFALQGFAQDDKSKRPSPPAQATATVDGVSVTVDYSKPSLKGRELNTLAPVGKVWRTGANEASWIEVSADVKINGNALPKGKYGLFTINNETEWTIIFNSVWNQWGAYKYEEGKDVLRVNVKPTTASDSVEQFTIDLNEKGEVVLKWGTQRVPFTISKG